MKNKGILSKYLGAIRDTERAFSERVFLVLALISEITTLVALIGDIATGEDIKEVLALAGIIIIVPTVILICLHLDKIRAAKWILVLGLVFLFLPALYFFGGGLHGGGVIWVIFACLFVGLTFTGTGRNVILFLIFVVTIISFLTEYYHPEFVTEHSRKVHFIDTFISIVLVGVVCVVMTGFQSLLLKGESNRAKKEAERAEELSRSQNRFFSSMSHEIRTPINSILGLNELILRDQTASEEIVRDAEGIDGSGKMLLALINDILDFSKMEAGSMDIVPVDYHVGDMISEIVNMIWLKAREKGLSFDVIVDPNVPSVLYGDEVRIKQMIINLLNNAVKYTSEGSVELRIESEGADDEKTLLRITVSDTGMGIKKESLPFLFDAFRRVDEEKNRYIEGTGLGLSIVKQLVELMDGTIAVDSIYGEGSTFVITLPQGISSKTGVGELSIHDQKVAKHGAYECSFKAPNAHVLIVDDNVMNLEVEKRLLEETEIQIDTVQSGREAINRTLKAKYDVILMDHLMPEMDGIECLKIIRNQSGGLNRNTPIIVLTANAGAENRELYNGAGFDGYVVKPVSGEQLEETMIRHISPDKLMMTDRATRLHLDIDMTAGYARKYPVIITSTSMCDLPEELTRRMNIPILPFVIKTEHGVFKDGVQMDADELLRYIGSGGVATSAPPDVSTYTEFFANALKRAHHIIHIALTTSMSKDYETASEAAKSFDNVIVINSGSLSSATGLLVMIASKLAQQGIPAAEIVEELETVKNRLKCSFVIDTTEHMVSKGLISPRIHRIAKALSLHPCLRIKNDKFGIGGVWVGSRKRAYKKYIHKAFPVDIIPDSEVVFITYADVPTSTLDWVKEEISKIAYFEHVVFMQASAAVSSNCGPGTFGILYFVKGNKSYNIGSMIRDDSYYEEAESEVLEQSVTRMDEQPELEMIPEDKPWYEMIPGIDGAKAIKNSGSEKAFLTVLKIFYDSIPVKTEELNGYFSSEDWANYIIKIHALKSSAKLIGALELSSMAEKLEAAGKASDIDYIKKNHADAMETFSGYSKILADYCADTEEPKEDKPVADESVMESVFDEIRVAAEAMDCESLEAIFAEMEEYSIPEKDRKCYEKIRTCTKNYDYDGILALLKG